MIYSVAILHSCFWTVMCFSTAGFQVHTLHSLLAMKGLKSGLSWQCAYVLFCRVKISVCVCFCFVFCCCCWCCFVVICFCFCFLCVWISQCKHTLCGTDTAIVLDDVTKQTRILWNWGSSIVDWCPTEQREILWDFCSNILGYFSQRKNPGGLTRQHWFWNYSHNTDTNPVWLAQVRQW